MCHSQHNLAAARVFRFSDQSASSYSFWRFEKMNSLFPGRKRALEPTAPTADQSRMAEEATYAAMCRGRSILVQKRSVLDRLTITHEVSQPPPPAKDALSDIGNTSVADFMSNFRVNGLECMQVAYE